MCWSGRVWSGRDWVVGYIVGWRVHGAVMNGHVCMYVLRTVRDVVVASAVPTCSTFSISLLLSTCEISWSFFFHLSLCLVPVQFCVLWGGDCEVNADYYACTYSFTPWILGVYVLLAHVMSCTECEWSWMAWRVDLPVWGNATPSTG